MMKMLGNLVVFIWSKFRITANLTAENLALRQQLAVMKRTNRRPKIRMTDRLFWVLLSRFWSPWRTSLVIVKPDTVVRWHRKGFKLFWKFKSKGPGRQEIDHEIRHLVRKMAIANPSWGAPRIHGGLLRLGFNVSERTVSNLMPRRPPNSKPSQTWRTFLKNHVNKCSIDFFTVPTAAFNILFVLVILRHCRRKVVHFNVTSNPSAQWAAQQVVEAFLWDTAPKYLMRDRDSIYGVFFHNRVKNMGIKEVISAPRSPWQKGKVERPFQYIEHNLLGGRKFQDLDDLKATARWWLQNRSDTHIHDTTGRPPLELFMEEELEALTSLPRCPYDVAEAALRICSIEGYLEFETNRYPIPYEYVTDILTLKATEHEIFVYSPELSLIVRHERLQTGAVITLDAKGIHGPRAVRYGLEPVRDQFLALGDDAEAFLEGLTGKQPKNGGFHVRAILRQK